jgi:hypothetical protein
VQNIHDVNPPFPAFLEKRAALSFVTPTTLNNALLKYEYENVDI